jgi:hypothetical protein
LLGGNLAEKKTFVNSGARGMIINFLAKLII